MHMNKNELFLELENLVDEHSVQIKKMIFKKLILNMFKQAPLIKSGR